MMKKPLLSHTLYLIIFFFTVLFISGCNTHRKLDSFPQSKPKIMGALLPLSGQHQSQGEAIKNGMLWACTQELKASDCQIHFYDTNLNGVMTAYEEAKRNQSEVILGPLLKTDVDTLMSRSRDIPVIALNQNSNQRTPPASFYELSLTPEIEIEALFEKALALNLNRMLIISSQDTYSQRLYRTFTDHWNKAGKTITETFFFTATTSFPDAIPNLLEKHRNNFDAILLFASSEDAQIILPLLRYNNLHTTILASSSVYRGSKEITPNIDLTSVIICDIDWSAVNSLPIPLEKQTRLFTLGRDAVILSQQLSSLNHSVHLWIGTLHMQNGSLVRSPYCKRIQNETH